MIKQTEISKNNGLGNAIKSACLMIPLGILPHHVNAQAIALTGTVDLNFGAITETGAGTVVVNNSGARSVTGGVQGVTGGTFESQGIFSISGITGVNITLSVTSPSFTVSNGSGDSMSVDAFNLVTNTGGASEVITLPASPTTFSVGARLNVSAGQAEGSYIGNYTINAVYQ